MEIRDLRSFVAVAEELHFGRAAARLHISPPPLSQRIKSLEQQLGAQLFVRTKRSVALTPAGVILLTEARRLCQRVDELPRMTQRAARGEANEVRVGVVGAAIYSQARALVADMTRLVPDIRLVWRVLSSVEQLREIRENRLDLGLVNTPIEHDDVMIKPLVRERLVVVMPSTHKYAKRKSIPLRLLRDEVFVIGERHLAPIYYDRVIAAFNAAGISPMIEHQAQSIIAYIGLVAIGVGMSIVPASLTRMGLSGVVFVGIKDDVPASELSVAWNPKNISPVLELALRSGPTKSDSGIGG